MLKRAAIKALLIALMFLLNGAHADTNSMPRVLVIGDSISMGYMPYVQRALAGQAEVVHSAGNAQDSANGLRNLESWLSAGRWDVISFNFGLWDLCYRRPGLVTQEGRDKVNGVIAVPLDEYEKNLNMIATRLISTKAKVIFQNTTVVPDFEPGRYSDDVERYNRVASDVMQRFHIPVNDLQTVTAALPNTLRESETDVHYAEPGYEQIAESVVLSIKAQL